MKKSLFIHFSLSLLAFLLLFSFKVKAQPAKVKSPKNSAEVTGPKPKSDQESKDQTLNADKGPVRTPEKTPEKKPEENPEVNVEAATEKNVKEKEAESEEEDPKTSQYSPSSFSWNLPTDPWSTLHWSGQFYSQFNLNEYRRPSSVEGHNDIDWGSLTTQQKISLSESNLALIFDLEVAPSSSTGTTEPEWSWQSLYLQGKNLDKNWDFELGILPDETQRRDRLHFSIERLGSAFRSGLVRWKIIPRTDAGFRLRQRVMDSHQLSLQVTNGEGWPQRQQGSQYDFQVNWMYQKKWRDSGFNSMIFYRQGRYEKLSSDQEQKSRLGAELSYEVYQSGQNFLSDEFAQFGVLGVLLKDPVDGIDGVVGNGVKLSTRGGLAANGSLAEAWINIKGFILPARYRIFGVSSDYTVDDQQSGKKINQLAMGFGYYITPGMTVDLSWDDTIYGANYAPSLSDQSRWFLSWSWLIGRVD